jgi:hypothetical protein
MSEIDALVEEFREYLKGKGRERMLRHKKSAPSEESDAPLNEGDGPDEPLPEECRTGMCEHPEHQDDDVLDDL